MTKQPKKVRLVPGSAVAVAVRQARSEGAPVDFEDGDETYRFVPDTQNRSRVATADQATTWFGEPTVEELARRQEVGARILANRTRRAIAPYTASDLVRAAREKRTLDEEWDNLRSQGFFRITLAGEERILDLSEENPKQIEPDTVRILIDRLIWKSGDVAFESRIADSIEAAFREGAGRTIVAYLKGDGSTEEEKFSEHFECANDGLAYEEPEPRLFSFNNPYGACPECQGFGRAIGIDQDLVTPDKSRTIRGGAIVCWNGPKFSDHLRELLAIAREADVSVDVPYGSLTERERKIVWEGFGRFAGVEGFFQELEKQTYKLHYRVMLSRFRGYTTCPKCHGSRLRPAAMNVRVAGKTMHDIVRMTIEEARVFFLDLSLSEYDLSVGSRILGNAL